MVMQAKGQIHPNQAAVLRPAVESATAARVRLQRCKRHVSKTDVDELKVLLDKAIAASEELELKLKRKLKQLEK